MLISFIDQYSLLRPKYHKQFQSRQVCLVIYLPVDNIIS